MAINMASPKSTPHHIEHSSFCWQYHCLDSRCASSQWEANTHNRLSLKEKASRSSGFWHSIKSYCPWCWEDLQAFGILQTFLDCEDKKHICFVGYLPIDVLKGHLTRWWPLGWFGGQNKHSSDEWSNLIFDLCGHACPMTLEDTRFVRTNAHQLSN